MSLFVVSAFFVLTLVVGFYFSEKNPLFGNMRLGVKNLATATLVVTVLATLYIGGALVCNIQCIHKLGLWWIVLIFLDCFGLWVVSKLALRMGPFMKHLSIAETIGNVYGNYSRIITALVGTCRCIIIITMQINVMSQAIRMCINIDNPNIVTIVCTLFLIFYSTYGGIRSVAFTDVLQFITVSIIIPLICWFIFAKIGRPAATMVPILQNYTKFQFSNLFWCNTDLMAMFFLLFTALVSYIAQPQLMQRVYMASGLIQARKVFLYAIIFNTAINSFVILISLFIFIDAPDLPKEKVLDYIAISVPPIFKGFVASSLLAMAMSTADSCLNSCAIMVGHDIYSEKPTWEKKSDAYRLKIARWTTLVVGLLATLLTFYCNDLLKLTYWFLDCAVPITAPFVLAVFGFRGTSRTALIGMATGVLSILIWNKWVEPSIGINGAFICMLANGLAMMVANYLLKQPKGTGWVGADLQFKQMQQAHARKSEERKEAIKNGLVNRKATLTKLVPSDATLRLTGLYMITTAIMDYWFIRPDYIHWVVCQSLVGAFFTSSKTFFSKRSRGWFMGLCWLIGLAVCLPCSLLVHCLGLIDSIFTTSLSLAHCVVILSVLPIYLGIGVVVATLVLAIYPIATEWSFPELSSLFPLFIVSLLVLVMTIWFKLKVSNLTTQILYIKNEEQIRESQKLKASLYTWLWCPLLQLIRLKADAILMQVVAKMEESISFLDSNLPLYKEDFNTIINKLYDWVAYFNRKAKAKKHVLLQSTQITLDKLIRKVELALSQEISHPPRLLIEGIREPNKEPSPQIVCDIDQIVYLLVQSVLRVGRLDGNCAPVVTIQLHPTALQFKQVYRIDRSAPVCILFQAIAFVVSQVITPPEAFPKVKELYDDTMAPQEQQATSPSIDLQQETISTIVHAHYGYWEVLCEEKTPTMLLVLPNDVTAILNKITIKLPLDALTLATPVTPKEQSDSMMALMKFHDYVCKSSYKEDPINVGTISGLLLLLRKHFGFKRHVSGQLFYVRAVGIATLVVEWVFHSPKVIYASLLYELVRHTCLPLSYIKEHYNLGVYAFVRNMVGIDKRQDLDHPSLLYVQNRLEEAIKEGHVQLSVLFIKLAERLYDLRHATGYINLTDVHHMAQETLAVDVKLANVYLGTEIGATHIRTSS